MYRVARHAHGSREGAFILINFAVQFLRPESPDASRQFDSIEHRYDVLLMLITLPNRNTVADFNITWHSKAYVLNIHVLPGSPPLAIKLTKTNNRTQKSHVNTRFYTFSPIS